METKNSDIDLFFERYATRFNKGLAGESPDIEATVESFAAEFIEAGPSGVLAGKNDEQFKAVIPRGYAYYQTIGIRSMDIVSKEIIRLDALHFMAKIHWKSNFVRKDRTVGSMEFDVIYLLQTIGNRPEIFAYITGDEQAALKENGLI